MRRNTACAILSYERHDGRKAYECWHGADTINWAERHGYVIEQKFARRDLPLIQMLYSDYNILYDFDD